MNDNNHDDQPKIHIDSDWKAEAQREKQKLQEAEAQKAEQGEPQQGTSGRELPPADFKALLSSIASQAMLYLGGIPDPQSGQRYVVLDMAQHYIDLLAVLEEKTQGNIDDEESKMLTQVLSELRMAYMQVSQASAQQQAQQAGEQGPAVPPENPFQQ